MEHMDAADFQKLYEQKQNALHILDVRTPM
jgi:hypothetical protein